MQQYEPTLSLVGRLLLAVLLLWAGLHKILNPEGTQQYMAAYGLTMGTMLLYLAATVVEFAGGLALGHMAREAVFLLVLFMVMVTGIFYSRLIDPNQVTQFAKNVAIIGGLFSVGAYGSGTLSMDAQDKGARHADTAGPHHAALTLAGRLCRGGLFLLSGLNKLLDPVGTRQSMVAMGMTSGTSCAMSRRSSWNWGALCYCCWVGGPGWVRWP